MANRNRFVIGTALMLGAIAGLGLGGGLVARAQVQSAGMMATQTTATYRVDLAIEPAMMMLTPDQAMGASMGEVMMSTPSMASDSMSSPSASPSSADMPNAGTMMMMTSDSGQAVNHHLEVHLANKATGMVASDAVPQITITNEATGASRSVSAIVQMYDVQMGQADLHFGNNVYLPDGSYSVTVMIGGETAQFSHVMVSNGMGLPADSMGSSMNAPTDPMQQSGH